MMVHPKMAFEEHQKTVLSKTNRIIDLLHKFQNQLPRTTVVTIYKAFVRPRLDTGIATFDPAFKPSFQKKLSPFIKTFVFP